MKTKNEIKNTLYNLLKERKAEGIDGDCEWHDESYVIMVALIYLIKEVR